MQLRLGLALFGSHPVPYGGFARVRRNTQTALIHESQVTLRAAFTLERCLRFPEQRLLVVSRDSASIKVHAPKLILGRRISLVCCQFEPTDRLQPVGFYISS